MFKTGNKVNCSVSVVHNQYPVFLNFLAQTIIICLPDVFVVSCADIYAKLMLFECSVKIFMAVSTLHELLCSDCVLFCVLPIQVIVKKDNKIVLYMKGADSKVFERLDNSCADLKELTLSHLNVSTAREQLTWINTFGPEFHHNLIRAVTAKKF